VEAGRVVGLLAEGQTVSPQGTQAVSPSISLKGPQA